MKNHYTVTVTHHYWEEFAIEAESEEEARELALSDTVPSSREDSLYGDCDTEVVLDTSEEEKKQQEADMFNFQKKLFSAIEDAGATMFDLPGRID